MKSALLKALALALGVFLLLSESESLLARGGRGGGGGRAGGGGGARAGGMGGGGRSFSAHRPAVSSGGFGGGGGLSRPQNVSRRSSSRPGGMVPNKNISGGNLKGSQAASKVQSRPRGSASSLPSTAQAK